MPYDFLSRCKFSTLTTLHFNSSTYGWILLTHVLTLTATDARIKIELTTSALWQVELGRCADYLLDYSGDKVKLQLVH